jgi:hypothetical protein
MEVTCSSGHVVGISSLLHTTSGTTNATIIINSIGQQHWVSFIKLITLDDSSHDESKYSHTHHRRNEQQLQVHITLT